MIYHTIKDRRDLLADVAAELAQIAGSAGDTANKNALNKAAYHLGRGLELVEQSNGDLLIPSGTRGGIIHRVNGCCSCEAGQQGYACWHLALKEIVMVAFERAAEAAVGTPYMASEEESPRERAYREMQELFDR